MSRAPSRPASPRGDDRHLYRINDGDVAELVIYLMERLEDRKVQYGYLDGQAEAKKVIDADPISLVDKYARKLLLFRCMKWFVDLDVEADALHFWLDATDYRMFCAEEDLPVRARELWDKYFRLDSPTCVDVSVQLREQVQAQIVSPTRSTFRQVQREVLGMLQNDYYTRLFKNSVFTQFAHAVNSILPANAGKKESVDLNVMLRKGRHVLNLMRELENNEDIVGENARDVDDPIALRSLVAIRRFLTFALLKHFFDKELSSENLEFWLAVDDFRLGGVPEKRDADPAAIKERAMFIWATYLQDGADREVNLSNEVKEKISAALGAPTRVIFDDAQAEILILIRRNAYDRFLKSGEYTTFQNKYNALPHFYDLDTDRRKRDARHRDKFKIKAGASVAKDFSCSLERKVSLHGHLLVSRTHLCFFANVFGFKTREVFPVRDVQNIVKNGEHIEITGRDKQFVLGDLSNPTKTLLTLRKLKYLSEHDVSARLVDSSAGEVVEDDAQEGIVLTEQDWHLFQEGARAVTFAKGEPVLREGDRSSSLYQIARGSVSIEKNGVSLRLLEEGHIFGEMSFLERGGQVSANVVAADEKVTVYVIDGGFIEGLLKVEPGLPGRFYKYLANILAEYLRTKKAPAKSAADAAGDAAGDDDGKKQTSVEKFRKTFGFPKDEEMLAQFPAKLKYHGKFFVSQNYISFYAKVLGMKTKEVIPLKSVQAITASDSHIEIMTEDKEVVFGHFDKMDDAYNKVITAWHASKQRRGPTPIKPQDGVERSKFEVLSESDLKMFLTGAKQYTYRKNEVILAEGSRSRCLYQIGKGVVRVEKQIPVEEDEDKPATGETELTVVRKMGAGVMFGEMSFLTGNAASASIVADQDAVEVYIIEDSFVESLLSVDPELPGRFYKFLALNLANRLRK